MNADKVKKQGKKGDGIYIFIIVILVIFNILLIKHIQSDKLAGLKEYLTEYYYSQENLDGAMRKKLGDIYDEGSYGNFENYVYKLVLDDINQYEPERLAGYNRIFSKAESERVENLFAKAGETTVTAEGEICCIKLSDFTPKETYSSLMQYSDLLKSSDKFIIDLRDNSGGSIDGLSKVLSLFYNKGEVVMTEVNDKETIEHKSKTDKTIGFDKLVFLCNENTASSAEAMIFCMKSDFVDKVSVVGTKTYGKNFTYAFKKFNDGHDFIFVSSLMCSGGKETFSENGISPDYEKSDDESFDFALELLNK